MKKFKEDDLVTGFKECRKIKSALQIEVETREGTFEGKPGDFLMKGVEGFEL